MRQGIVQIERTRTLKAQLPTSPLRGLFLHLRGYPAVKRGQARGPHLTHPSPTNPLRYCYCVSPFCLALPLLIVG